MSRGNPDKEVFSDRVKKRRKALGMTQVDLARKSELSQATVANIEAGRNKGTSNLGQLAAALKCNALWLETGRGQWSLQDMTSDATAKNKDDIAAAQTIIAWESPGDLEPDRYAMIPHLDAAASAGNGGIITTAPEKDTPQAFRIDWLNTRGWKEKDLFLMGIEGDSMEPTLTDGSTIMIHRKETRVIDGKVYLLRIGGTIQVKRLYALADGGLQVVSDNRNYPEKIIPGEQMQFVAILGRLVWAAVSY